MLTRVQAYSNLLMNRNVPVKVAELDELYVLSGPLFVQLDAQELSVLDILPPHQSSTVLVHWMPS
eukprot:2715279-Amphidinium_carterae.1